jgi:hypothetical protein
LKINVKTNLWLNGLLLLLVFVSFYLNNYHEVHSVQITLELEKK